MTDYDELTTSGIFSIRTKPCENCKKPVEVSPGNSSWVSSGVTSLTKVEFTMKAPCHRCGHINYYIQFMKKSTLKMTDGLQEEV